MEISVRLMRQLDTVDPELRQVLYAILEEIERQSQERVTKDEFRELKEIVQSLAQAQARTEARIEELAQAQARTEARVEELAQAQARTEARVEELAQAQAKPKQRSEIWLRVIRSCKNRWADSLIPLDMALRTA